MSIRNSILPIILAVCAALVGPVHAATVPDADNTVNGVVFTTSANTNTDLINIRAEIPMSAASPASRLFGRLYSTGN